MTRICWGPVTTPTPHSARWLDALGLALLALGMILKVGLLASSQSMADGDEAVEGLMALHILERGVHPIYPYGIAYGAGVFLETHLAAMLFRTLGPSDIALKSVGLLWWVLSLAAVYAIGRRMGGRGAAMAAALLFAFAPQAAQWSLKVAGGHQVGVVLALAILLLLERPGGRWLAVGLVPVAGFAHPIVLPFAAIVGLTVIARAHARERLGFAVVLAASSAVTTWLLWPPGGIWDPSVRSFEPLGLLVALPRLALTLHSPNLSSARIPSGPVLVVAGLWLAALAAVLVAKPAPRRLVGYGLATLAVVAVVSARELAARHLLLLYPISCLILGLGLSSFGRRGWAALALLLVAGAAIQVREMRSPTIHGAGIQSRGVDREAVRALVAEIEGAGVGHVYSLDPMLQWNIIFATRERVVARWKDPRDRLPEYPARVDAARRAGFPVALVVDVAGGESGPQSFEWISDPDPEEIERVFPASPGDAE